MSDTLKIDKVVIEQYKKEAEELGITLLEYLLYKITIEICG